MITRPVDLAISLYTVLGWIGLGATVLMHVLSLLGRATVVLRQLLPYLFVGLTVLFVLSVAFDVRLRYHYRPSQPEPRRRRTLWSFVAWVFRFERRAWRAPLWWQSAADRCPAWPSWLFAALFLYSVVNTALVSLEAVRLGAMSPSAELRALSGVMMVPYAGLAARSRVLGEAERVLRERHESEL